MTMNGVPRRRGMQDGAASAVLRHRPQIPDFCTEGRRHDHKFDTAITNVKSW
jgi:hypothetical protein